MNTASTRKQKEGEEEEGEKKKVMEKEEAEEEGTMGNKGETQKDEKLQGKIPRGKRKKVML